MPATADEPNAFAPPPPTRYPDMERWPAGVPSGRRRLPAWALLLFVLTGIVCVVLTGVGLFHQTLFVSDDGREWEGWIWTPVLHAGAWGLLIVVVAVVVLPIRPIPGRVRALIVCLATAAVGVLTGVALHQRSERQSTAAVC